jgi:hypothetical protein
LSKCSAITRSGERCKGMAIDASGLCHAHHPDRAEARRRAGHKGGKRGGRGRPQAELADIKQRLSELADAVLEDKVDKGKGAVASQVLNVYLRAIGMELKVKEVTELEERLEELEASLERQNRTGRGCGA